MTLKTALVELRELALDCPDVKAAPNRIPENIAMYPFVVVYPNRGVLNSEGAAQARSIHTVTVEFHVCPRTAMNLNVDKSIDMLDDYNDRLVLNPTLSGAVSNIVFPCEYTWGILDWADTQNLGFRISVPLKIRAIAST